MINVCAKYCGTVILLESFETVDKAEDFMQRDYVLIHSDEFMNDEDEIIKHEDMFLEDELPFFEKQISIPDIDLDELPF